MPVVSSLAHAFASCDVAHAMAATLFWALFVEAEFTSNAKEPRVALALRIFAYASLTALLRAASQGARAAHVPRCTVTSTFVAYSMMRAVIFTTNFVAGGAGKVTTVTHGAIFATVLVIADALSLGTACAVAATIAWACAPRAVFAHPTILT